MIILDGTIVTVALPAIQTGLGFTAASLSWVMTAYLIAFGGLLLLLLGGRLGDLLGRKRMLVASLAALRGQGGRGREEDSIPVLARSAHVQVSGHRERSRPTREPTW